MGGVGSDSTQDDASGEASSAPVDPRVSVALCTYNGAAYLGEQLASILAQTVLPGEIVVSDDGSTDGTIALVERIAATSSVPIRLLRNETPLRVTLNFQSALLATSGSLLVLSDQDDRWHPHRLEHAIARFDADEQLSLLFTDARLVDAAGADLGFGLLQALSVGDEERAAFAQTRPADGPSDFDTLLRRNLVTGATVMLRRALLDDAVPFPSPWVHDEWLAIIASAVGRVGLLDEQLIDYRQHGANQIGIVEPTLRYKITRLMLPGRQRNRDIVARIEGLVARLESFGDRIPAADLDAARRKLDVERFRANLPPARWRRILPVLRRVPRGEYQRYTSQGVLDIARDLLQPELRSS
ncbi:glycosyltransferase family 2 protein [Plantibacter sp. YIM 135249]|uniref:glycosyltransferase family 2 protein n=1 Tax=Plantibacter sp. YIM 135249 TaxID=3423918 RepID=UPI003D35395B